MRSRPSYAAEPATFQGIRRADGRVATRNYIGIVTSVNCSAHVAELIAQAFRRNPLTGEDPLAEWPNVDGVVALTHKTGCGMTQGEPLTLLRRTLGGFARHANFSNVIAIGLGCEVNQIGGLLEEQKLSGRLRNMDIQEMGGTRKTVQAGIDFVREVLAEANQVRRTTVPVSELCVALQCGGSDGYSGITANRGARRRQRPGGAERRHGDPVREPGDLWRRAPADPPRGQPRGRPEAGRRDALVGSATARARGRRWMPTPRPATSWAG